MEANNCLILLLKEVYECGLPVVTHSFGEQSLLVDALRQATDLNKGA